MESKQLRQKTTSREVSSRFFCSSSSPVLDTAPFSRHGLSPLRRKSTSEAPRKHRSATDDALIRNRWPSSLSSSSKRSNTLADHLGNDRLTDLIERKKGDQSTAGPQSISRQRSCSEFNRFEKKKEEEGETGKISKENRPIGGSMRYISKLRFPRSSPKPESLPIPGRLSVDENALANRRKSDFGIDFPSSESDRSETKTRGPKIPKPRNKDSNPKSADRMPTAKLVAATAIRRTSSLSGYGSAATQWALSPGRRPCSPPQVTAVMGPDGSGTPSRSFSSLRPPSPDKGRKVGNFISIGLDLFRKKSGSMPSSPTMVVGEMAHQFRLLHNRLIQWRYMNARSDGVNKIRMANGESTLVSTWVGISNLQASVVQKRVQLEKEKLKLKLNRVLSSQIKSLEGWGDMERQHTSALSTTKDCLQAAVCRLPLADGAKADPQPLSTALRQATNLAATIKTTISIYTPMAQNTVPLLSELAHVVTKERILLEECLELLGQASSLQIQEQSLRCSLIQLKSWHQQRQQLSERHFVMTKWPGLVAYHKLWHTYRKMRPIVEVWPTIKTNGEG